MFNRYSDRAKSTAATEIANMILKISAIRLQPVFEKALETKEVSGQDWDIVYKITSVLKVVAPFGEDTQKAVSEMTTEEILAALEQLKNAPEVEGAISTEEQEDFYDDDEDDDEVSED